MSCYGKTLLFSIGDCPSTNKTVTNLRLTSLNDKVKTSLKNINQSNRTSVVTVQNQTIGFKKFPATMSLEIGQRMDIKVGSESEMTSTITEEDMEKLATNLKTQLDSTLKMEGDSGADRTVNEKINNVKKSIIQVVKKESTLNSAQSAISERVTVNDSNIFIDFADFNSEMSKVLIAKFKTPGSTASNPSIKISQELLADIQINSAMASVAESISKDTQVIDSQVELIEELASKNLGIAGVSSTYIKELSATIQRIAEEGGDVATVLIEETSELGQAVSEDVTDTVKTVAEEAGSFGRTIIIIIGVVIVAIVIGIVFFGKSLFENPEAIKAIGSMTPAGRIGGVASAMSPAPPMRPSAPVMRPPPMSASVPKAAFGFGSCGYRFR